MEKCRVFSVVAVPLLFVCSDLSRDDELDSYIGHLNTDNIRGAFVSLNNTLESDLNYSETSDCLNDAYLQVGLHQQLEYEFLKDFCQNVRRWCLGLMCGLARIIY